MAIFGYIFSPVVQMVVSFFVGEKLVEPSIPSVVEFFPGVRGDASRVAWAHAVNNVSLLESALDDNRTMMLEADVLEGRLVGGPDDRLVPVMAHPPANSSDLSLERFLDRVIEARASRRLGIKLDFKQLAVVEESLKMLQKRREKLDFPVWLNADVLPGPVDAPQEPVDADAFLRLCTEYLPSATLSLGWKVHVPDGYRGGGAYGMAHARSMVDVIRRRAAGSRITFPVFALFAAEQESVKTFQWLLGEVAKGSLTVWGGTRDAPYHDRQGLASLKALLGADRVFYDLPYDLFA